MKILDMLVELDLLLPNPYRDFAIDPIDEEVIDQLTELIVEDGFWGGVVCRRNGRDREIGAGEAGELEGER